MIIFASIISGFATSLLVAQASGRPLTVCDLLTNRIEYNHKVILVRGYVIGSGHGAWIEDESSCPIPIQSRPGIYWKSIIHLAFPNNRSIDATDHAPFDVDWRSITKLHRMGLKAHYNERTDRQLATYEGLFVTYDDLNAHVFKEGGLVILRGFGGGGGTLEQPAPAQLLIKSARNLVIQKNAKVRQSKQD